MMKKVYKLVVLLLLCQTYVFAQNISVTGKVTDSDNLPLPAVSIKVSGSTQGTSTDANGNFTISSTHEGTFNIINELGQLIQRVEISKENNLNVKVENLSRGVYFVTGVINNEVVTNKIVVQ